MQRKLYLLAAPLAAALALTACGGGGDGGNAAASQPPPAAADASDGFIAYVKDLIAKMSDSAEPADVSAFDPPPVTNTREPVATQ